MEAKIQMEDENEIEQLANENKIEEERETERSKMEAERETNGDEVEDVEMIIETEESQMEEQENGRDVEVAPALIAVHPFNGAVAVAVGSDLRIFDLERNCSASLANGSKEMLHKDSIRAVRFSEGGKLLVSAGDDKLVKIWSADTWQCLLTVNSEKRVSAVSISRDEQFVCFADKFGVVWAVKLEGLLENQALSDKKAVPILAHYCSIITSLEFSPDGQFIVSGDRDFKIRVTAFPKNPLKGAHEIQSYCLGHSEYVTCVAFIHNLEYPQGFLLSGSGDSTVRLWDIPSGSLICTCDVKTEAGLLKESHAAVTDLCATPDGSLVAVAIQSLQGILMLSCDLSARAFCVIKVVSIMGEVFIPTSLGAGFSTELLWMVTGVSNLPDLNASSLARVKAISGFKKSISGTANHELAVLEDVEVPGGEQLLEKLQGSTFIESKIISAAADAVRGAMSNLLIKKQYTEEKREFRKRRRNDKKFRRK
ncbi:hypothetical protein Ancab_020040 [Ancistrocladus abbreviatus]